MDEQYLPLCASDPAHELVGGQAWEEIVEEIIAAGMSMKAYRGHMSVNGPVCNLLIIDDITIRLYRIDRFPFSAWLERQDRTNPHTFWSAVWEKLEGQYLEAMFDC